MSQFNDILGIKHGKIDAYIAGIEYFSQIIITCEYIDGNVYNHSDYNSLGVVLKIRE